MLPWGTSLLMCFADETLILTFTVCTGFCKYGENSFRNHRLNQNWKTFVEGYQWLQCQMLWKNPSR